MKTIKLNIPDDKFDEIIRFCGYKKMTTGFNPGVDPLDWLAIEFIEAARADAIKDEQQKP